MDPRSSADRLSPLVPVDPSQPTFEDFPGFLDNPVVRQLAQNPRWTLSDSRKRPMDMWAMVRGEVVGASEPSPGCLMRLDQLNAVMPQAANNAYFLSYRRDGYMVIDIEKTCPEHLRDELLALPCLYSELSMSGKGYHLVMPAPDVVDDHPDALLKTVLRHPRGWYEILLEHYVTFTRRPVPAHLSGTPGRSWDEVYAELASQAVASERASLDMTDQAPDIPCRDELVGLLSRQKYSRDLASFHGDNSAYEFGYAGFLWNKLELFLVADKFSRSHAWTDEHKAWIIYLAMVKVLEHRPKHDEVRSRMPLLLNTAANLVARRSADRDPDRKKEGSW